MFAKRNQAIKKLLTNAFAPNKVSIRGSRGTAYGWVRVHIAYSPRNNRETRELRARVEQLIVSAKIEIGTYGYDDPGSDYGYGKRINIDFDSCREKADYYCGDDSWKHNLSAEEWDALQKQEATQ